MNTQTNQHKLKHNPMYPTANSLDEALAEIKTRLPIENSIQLKAAIMLYHNSLIKELNK
jgi:hypothetical protein